MTGRKQRIDSITAAVGVVASANIEILPPEHCPLPEGAMPFWSAIVRGRAREEWNSTPSLLATASSLAWTQWQIVLLRQMYEGVVPLPDGMKSAMLASRMIDLQRLEMAYLRTLQQHGRGAQGEARDVAARRAATSDIERTTNIDDELLASPTVQ